MNYTAMGKRIRKQRRSLHMTQECLAEKAGISLSFMGHIERGTRKASMDTFVSIVNILNISPAVLLQESLLEDYTTPAKENSTSNRQRTLINEISRVILENYDD